MCSSVEGATAEVGASCCAGGVFCARASRAVQEFGPAERARWPLGSLAAAPEAAWAGATEKCERFAGAPAEEEGSDHGDGGAVFREGLR